jgi:small subunit ribosomal protein S3Ae
MAIGKNKRLTKSKKGGKKKAQNPFDKKEWYSVKVPSIFKERTAGKTLITRTQGTKIASEGLKGRVFEVSLADLNKDEDHMYRKIKLCCEDVQGYNVVTNFHGMDLTRDKLCSLIKKWVTLVEANVDVKTTDGYTLRLFCIAFTAKMPGQMKKTCYAQAAQIRKIRAKMVEIMTKEASSEDLKGLINKLIPNSIGDAISKGTSSIFPLRDCMIRKVKMLKKPKFDIIKLMEMHGDDGAEDTGKGLGRDEVLVETVKGSGGRL